jgi:tRNA threonylcarbamoyladenosine biosynthesis protein TsaE
MHKITERVTQSPEETLQLGVALAHTLGPGDCVALRGDLGSGKTCLTQGICKGLEVADYVTSPTFILMNEYAGVTAKGVALPIYHFDLYRLGDPDELYALGCDDFFYGNGICMIEWADMGGDLIPKEAIDIVLTHEGHSLRKVIISGRAL